MSQPPQHPDSAERANPEWFREPTRREHAIAGALFGGFGIFFVLLSFVLAGWWFRWVILGLGIVSILRGARHTIIAARKKIPPKIEGE